MDEDQKSLEKLDLQQIPSVCWQLLREGADSATSAMHTPGLATSGDHGPSLRTVVLRYCDEDQRTLACHSDVRAAKILEAKNDPRASWLFYDRERKLQLRLAGLLSIHSDDGFADSRWDQTTALGRACYNMERSPGQRLLQPSGAPGRPGSEREAQAARGHFAVLACRIDFMDWLLLSIHGHRRAQFRWMKGCWEATWVSP